MFEIEYLTDNGEIILIPFIHNPDININKFGNLWWKIENSRKPQLKDIIDQRIKFANIRRNIVRILLSNEQNLEEELLINRGMDENTLSTKALEQYFLSTNLLSSYSKHKKEEINRLICALNKTDFCMLKWDSNIFTELSQGYVFDENGNLKLTFGEDEMKLNYEDFSENYEHRFFSSEDIQNYTNIKNEKSVKAITQNPLLRAIINDDKIFEKYSQHLHQTSAGLKTDQLQNNVNFNIDLDFIEGNIEFPQNLEEAILNPSVRKLILNGSLNIKALKEYEKKGSIYVPKDEFEFTKNQTTPFHVNSSTPDIRTRDPIYDTLIEAHNYCRLN